MNRNGVRGQEDLNLSEAIWVFKCQTVLESRFGGEEKQVNCPEITAASLYAATCSFPTCDILILKFPFHLSIVLTDPAMSINIYCMPNN